MATSKYFFIPKIVPIFEINIIFIFIFSEFVLSFLNKMYASVKGKICFTLGSQESLFKCNNEKGLVSIDNMMKFDL